MVDHAIWFMVNHLEQFFTDEEYPSLKAKFIAFFVWMRNARKLAAKCQITINHSRKWLCEGAKEMTNNFELPLFKDQSSTPGL
jgi:hypothetical protein